MRRFTLHLAVVAALALSAVLAACGDGETPLAGDGPSGEVTVFAAASLREAFEDIAADFEGSYPGSEIIFNFAGTPTLRTQIEQGARADVFASADREQMDLARRNGVVETASTVFARNVLVIITPSDNPGGLESAADLARDGLRLVLAQENVPVGAYTRQVLDAMSRDPSYGPAFADSVLNNVVSLESNVKQVAAKVELGEADAGIVYGTDVTPALASKLQRIEIPGAFNVTAEYPAALVTGRRNDALARAFIDFLVSDRGQAALARYGFLSAG